MRYRDSVYGFVETVGRSVRSGAKTLLNARAYLFAMAVLALGIGMSAAVFSVTRAVLFNPLPFPGQDALRVIWKADPHAGVPFLELAYPELLDLQQRVPAFSSVAVMPTTLYGYGKVLRIGKQAPVQIESAPVSHEFFRTLAVRPILGRDFKDSDEHPGAAPVTILSNGVWRAQFHADPDVIGRQIVLNGQGYTVIGVMARDIDFPRGVGLWVPLGVNDNRYNRAAYYLQAIARVKPGYSENQVNAQVNGLFKRLAVEHRKFYSPTQQAVITDLPRYWAGSARLQLLVSLGASLLLFLTACITASNLFLSRTLARQHEIATRAALGATASRIFLQLFTEGLMAGTAAAIAGVAIAWTLIKLLVVFAPPDIPRLAEAGLDWPVLGLSVLLAVVAAAACSIAPALIANRVNLGSFLREGGPTVAGSRIGNRMQNAFIVAQTATGVVLLTASLFVVISVRSMMRTEIGFAHTDTVTMNLAYRGSGQARLFYMHLLERLKASPGVTDAGAVLVRPLEGSIGWDMSYRPEFDTNSSPKELPVSNFEVVTPGYFRTVGTPILQGRDFTDHDREDTRKVVIISNGLAERMRLGGHRAMGTRIRLGKSGEGDWWTIVGVTGNTRYRGVTTRNEDIYVSYLQSSIPVRYVVIRGRGTTKELAALARRQVSALDPNQAVANVATIGQLIDRDTARQRFNMVLLCIFGFVSLLLAAVGVYSVIAEMVSLKIREIAIRLALGAGRSRLVWTFMGTTIRFALAGELVGLAGWLLLGRSVSSLLYGIGPQNPIVLAAVLVFVLLVSGAAASIPAWAASGENPRGILQ